MEELNNTRVFFIVQCAEFNIEIFEILEKAEKWYYHQEMKGATDLNIGVAVVKNAYKEDDGGWNYDDHSDTFEFTDYDFIPR